MLRSFISPYLRLIEKTKSYPFEWRGQYFYSTGKVLWEDSKKIELQNRNVVTAKQRMKFIRNVAIILGIFGLGIYYKRCQVENDFKEVSIQANEIEIQNSALQVQVQNSENQRLHYKNLVLLTRSVLLGIQIPSHLLEILSEEQQKEMETNHDSQKKIIMEVIQQTIGESDQKLKSLL
jgi:hypothetical protein